MSTHEFTVTVKVRHSCGDLMSRNEIMDSIREAMWDKVPDDFLFRVGWGSEYEITELIVGEAGPAGKEPRTALMLSRPEHEFLSQLMVALIRAPMVRIYSDGDFKVDYKQAAAIVVALQ